LTTLFDPVDRRGNIYIHIRTTMPPDPRVWDVDHFTKTIHSSVPSNLKPEHAHLPPDFTVCIVGAGKGIGEHIAYAYAKADVRQICIASRTRADLETVASKIREINTDADVVVGVCDIASAASVEALAALVAQRFGRLDVVLPNAAYAPPIIRPAICEGKPEEIQRAFDINVMGTYHVAHYFLPLLKSSPHGAKAFLAIGSIAGCIRRGIIANTGYTVSKMAQLRLVEYLAEQYGEQGVFALSVHPGAVNTDMAKDNTPEAFMPYLTDDVALCGAVCVWLSARLGKLNWLGGRLVSACWDMDELMTREEEIKERDLLKFELLVR
jgi:NAD(P)-dependent dehydrogenase (short-subunit alcohol dehydrogenase family)